MQHNMGVRSPEMSVSYREAQSESRLALVGYHQSVCRRLHDCPLYLKEQSDTLRLCGNEGFNGGLVVNRSASFRSVLQHHDQMLPYIHTLPP